MDSFNFTADLLHKHRAQELEAEARIERFLQQQKNHQAESWLQRRLLRSRKTR